MNGCKIYSEFMAFEEGGVFTVSRVLYGVSL